MENLIITVSSSGGKWTRSDSPYLPLTPAQIIEDILRGYDAGATIAHIHARDEDGKVCEPGNYKIKVSDAVKNSKTLHLVIVP